MNLFGFGALAAVLVVFQIAFYAAVVFVIVKVLQATGVL